MEITIIGLGYVGLVNACYLAALGNQILGYDVNKEKISMLRHRESPIEEPGIEELLTAHKDNLDFTANYKDACRNVNTFFVCVDTPQGKDGSADLTNFNSVIETIAQNITCNCRVFIRSTVPIGTNRRVQKYFDEHAPHHVDVISFPEFLSQGCALENMKNPYRLVFGRKCKDQNPYIMELIRAFNVNMKQVPVMRTAPENAELIKYASNCFLAMKISYINNIAQLCESVGADVEKIAEGMSYDPRIGGSFLKAGIGYGGSCFPKDTNGLNWLAEDKQVEMELVKSTIKVNETQVDFFLNKLYSRFKNIAKVNISVLGVSFKGGTEDVRSSRAVPVIKSLLEKGAVVKVYDRPAALDNFHALFARHSHIKYMLDIKDCLKDADVVLILNDSKEFKELTANDFISLMKRPIIFDGRNLYNFQDMEGTEYHSIGRMTLMPK